MKSGFLNTDKSQFKKDFESDVTKYFLNENSFLGTIKVLRKEVLGFFHPTHLSNKHA